MNETAPAMELRDVTKDFLSGGQPLSILKGLDLKIYAGETIAITGPSGSGKSTLLGLLAGLDHVSTGEILLGEAQRHQWNEDQLAHWRRTDVGFVFQDFRLISSFTALENVSLPLEILGTSAPEAQKRAHHLLTSLGLQERAHHYPHQLSGGEQQRVAICRAYAHEPKWIFADEPTGNLDPETSEHVLQNLLQMNEGRETTLMLVTHDLDLARRMDRQIALKSGILESIQQKN